MRLTVVVFNVLTFGLYRFVTVEREMKERALTKHFGNKVKFTSAHATQGTFENGRSHFVLQKAK